MSVNRFRSQGIFRRVKHSKEAEQRRSRAGQRNEGQGLGSCFYNQEQEAVLHREASGTVINTEMKRMLVKVLLDLISL